MVKRRRRKDHGAKQEEETKVKGMKKTMNEMAENSGKCHPYQTKLRVAIYKDKEKKHGLPMIHQAGKK